MGKITLVSKTSSTACCYYRVSSTGTTTGHIFGFPGVIGTTSGKVIGLNWAWKSLRGAISSEIGKLVDLHAVRIRKFGL